MWRADSFVDPLKSTSKGATRDVHSYVTTRSVVAPTVSVQTSSRLTSGFGESVVDFSDARDMMAVWRADCRVCRLRKSRERHGTRVAVSPLPILPVIRNRCAALRWSGSGWN